MILSHGDLPAEHPHHRHPPLLPPRPLRRHRHRLRSDEDDAVRPLHLPPPHLRRLPEHAAFLQGKMIGRRPHWGWLNVSRFLKRHLHRHRRAHHRKDQPVLG